MHTPRKRAINIQYAKDGLSQSDIARKMNLSRSVVCRILARFRMTGSSDGGHSNGRPRITSARENNMIRRSVVKNPMLSSLQVKVDTGAASTRTIRRRLVDTFKLFSRRATKKPLLNAVQRRKRLAFCKKYQKWTAADWSKVLFSDETTLCQFGGSSSGVRRPSGQRFNPKYTSDIYETPKESNSLGFFFKFWKRIAVLC